MADEIAELVVKITGDASGLESTINGVSSELSKLEKAQGGGNSATASGTKGLAAYGQQLQNTGKSIKDFGEGLDTVTKPLQYTSVALATGGVAAAKFAIDFEDSFASVKKTVDGTPEQLDAIKQSIIDMSTVGINGHSAIPMTTAELNELAAAGGQLGIQTENIADFTEVMAQMGTATNLVGEEGAATLARFMNVMGISQGEIRNVGSAIVDLGNNSATTESEIAAMALRMGKYGSTIGMSAADVLGYSAALSSLGIEAQMGGSAIGRTWLSIESAVASGGDALNVFAKYSGKSAKEFKEQWNTDSKGAFNGLLKGLQSADNLTLALDKLGINNTQDIQAMMALVNGYDLVTASVERANIAYAENTALQAEFDAKAETTASQLAIVKNNFVEAARSIGETMLPTIKDASAGLVDWAQKLASMDDSQKKTLVNTAAGVVALGAASKGIVGITKGVGGLLEGIGSIKKAMGAGGALAKMAPTLTGIASAAGPAAIGIAAIGTAAVAGKVAYDAWYNSNYKFADGLSENVEQLKSYKERMQELNDLQWEYNELNGKINSNNLSGEELESAKSRLEEIKNILQEKYKIDLNSEDIDNAIKKAEKLEKLNFYNQKKELRDDIEDLAPNYEKAVKSLPQLEAEYEKAQNAAQAYSDTMVQVAEWQDDYEKGTIKAEDYTAQFTKTLNSLGKTFLDNDKYGDQMLARYKEQYGDDLSHLSAMAQLSLSGLTDGLNIENLEQKISDAKQAIEEYKESVQALAAIDLSELKDDFANGVVDNSTAGAEIDAIVEKVGKLDSGLQRLHENGKIDVKFNVDTGGLDIFDLNGNKLGEITANGKINWSTGELPVIEDQDGKIIYYGDYSNLKAPTLYGTIEYTKVLGGGGSNFNKFANTGGWKNNATGTQNFPGGLAMVNDQTGIADNRELIIDRGRAFIPQGRNVILPLSKGAKVYTAAQTKAIMSGLGIPHYAEGKNNSDAFTAARDDWTHYTKTHAVTTAQELQKYLEFQEQFKDNEKDIWDIEEQIFSLMQKQTKELGDQSKAYIEERAALNDWEEVGDSPLEAFGRIKDRNYQDLQDAKITWDDYVKNVSDAGKTLYEAMLDQSDTWLEDQRKYHNMSVDDYIAGINREQQRLEEFYAADMLNYKEYVEYRRDLANKEADAIAEKNADEYAAWQKDADAWEEMRSTYGDWDKYGDSEEDFHKRKIERVKKFYEAGTISFEQFIDDTNRYSMDLYKVQEGTIDDLLQKQSDYISDLREQFSKQEQALRDSWDVEDRAVDMADLQNQLDVYANAVTDRGQQKYKELQDQMKQLQRDEELYNLQVANNATIESLESEYKQMEDNKANILEGLRTANVNISAYVDSISENLSQTGGRVESLLGQLLTAFNGFQINAPSTTYADNRTVNVSGLSLSEFARRYMGGLKI